jgi:hypothetical protein
MQRDRRRDASRNTKQWAIQRVGDNSRYMMTEEASTSVVARRNAHEFWWEEPKEPQASPSPGHRPESPEVALWKTVFFLQRVYGK